MKDVKMYRTMQMPVLLVLLASFGCGGGSTVPFEDNSQDADKYALSVKQSASDQIAGAMSSPEPGDQISAIVSLLENPDNRPAGPHEAIYLEILAAAEKLTADCNAAQGRPDGLEESLTKLKALADKLPGTVNEAVVEEGTDESMPEQE